MGALISEMLKQRWRDGYRAERGREREADPVNSSPVSN